MTTFVSSYSLKPALTQHLDRCELQLSPDVTVVLHTPLQCHQLVDLLNQAGYHLDAIRVKRAEQLDRAVAREVNAQNLREHVAWGSTLPGGAA